MLLDNKLKKENTLIQHKDFKINFYWLLVFQKTPTASTRFCGEKLINSEVISWIERPTKFSKELRLRFVVVNIYMYIVHVFQKAVSIWNFLYTEHFIINFNFYAYEY